MFRRLAPFAALFLFACASGPATSPPPQAAQGPQAMVAAANPLAVEAGLRLLKAGGSAMDAAVAVQAVLGLVEPQSSGLGGGAFITYYDAKTRKVSAYNGREAAPAGATPDMFLLPGGKPMSLLDGIRSGRSTGAPGAVAMLALAHGDHGRLPWRGLFDDAERLARDGFAVSPRLAEMIRLGTAIPGFETPDMTAYFTKPEGGRYAAGDLLRNPAYADTVRALAEQGPKALYDGPIADDFAAKAREEPRAGTLTAADIKAYEAKREPPLCRPYRIYVVCAPPPPSSGVALLQALAILQHTDIDKRGPNDPKAWSQFIQASRLTYADRDRYVGDDDFVAVPVEGMLDPAYVARRAAMITEPAGPPPPPGSPPGAGARAPDATVEPGGTTHFVIVDAAGNVVSMTTTVESAFGSGRMTHGFFLNNQLTDFSFLPREGDGVIAANAAAPGKRPRSSMSPVIVLDRQGRLVAAIGSPGGNSIIAYNLKALVGVLDWKLSVGDAAALPNVVARGQALAGEVNALSPEIRAYLAAQNLEVKPSRGEASGIHGVVVRDGVLTGGADPRREGVAKGF